MRLLTNRLAAALALMLGLGATITALPGMSEAQARGRGQPIVIMNDKGGNVVKTIRHRNRLVASGRPVEIRGYCRSACTIYITMPNACLSPRATVGFHAPRLPGTTIIPPVVDELMAQFYRNGILRKWNSEWKYSLKMHKISAREYVRLDPQTRLCRK
ncbi:MULTISPECIES: hypothetical protein [Paracoccus]|uniref:Lipoprotein n=1 Tax=Paracoccus kondratievae TaxID=135740 RepID=A0AAD3NXB5_9RHOB|nr:MULTISPECIES: hypothetical protein [Paracoccus]GLK63080.1 hypothetical protein GCM10017635_05490 [Paracoccus kondratievae]SMG08638.1 hypothetical protein SAMN02746000_00349 [Paracoccus sp. J56]